MKARDVLTEIREARTALTKANSLLQRLELKLASATDDYMEDDEEDDEEE